MLVATASKAMLAHQLRCVGSIWTTDAPFRETTAAIEAARDKGILAVEMKASAPYAFAKAAGVRVLCLAHVTNTMGQSGDGFEKGEADGTYDALAVLDRIVRAFLPGSVPPKGNSSGSSDRMERSRPLRLGVAQQQPHDLVPNFGDRRKSDHVAGLAQDLVSRPGGQLRPAQHDGCAKVLEDQLIGRTI